MNLPKKYEWLLVEPGPKMLLEFLKIYGVTEIQGDSDNPIILDWAKETGLAGTYKHDSTPWCALFMALIAQRAGKVVPPGPLWALNWAQFGVKVTGDPMLGDVLVFKRKGGGHVTMYLGEDDECYHCGGGNQGDTTGIVRKAKNRLYVARRPIYTIQPANVRRVFLSAEGEIDVKES